MVVGHSGLYSDCNKLIKFVTTSFGGRISNLIYYLNFPIFTQTWKYALILQL